MVTFYQNERMTETTLNRQKRLIFNQTTKGDNMRKEAFSERLAFCLTARQREWVEVFARTNEIRISDVIRNFIETMIVQYHEKWDADYQKAKPRREEILLLHDGGQNIHDICSTTGLFPESVRRIVQGYRAE